MAKVSRPAHPDSVVNRCIVGRSKSGWTWVCLDCGEGAVTGKAAYFKWQVYDAARKHTCLQTPPAAP